MEKLENLIAIYPFFCGMNKSHLKKLADCAKLVNFEQGRLVCEDNENAHYSYLIMDGRVAVELESPEHGELLIQTLWTGDILGWSWLVPPYKWRFNARAVVATSAVAFNTKRLRALCEKDRHLSNEILKRFLIVITARLEATRIQLLDLYGFQKRRKKHK